MRGKGEAREKGECKQLFVYLFIPPPLLIYGWLCIHVYIFVGCVYGILESVFDVAASTSPFANLFVWAIAFVLAFLLRQLCGSQLARKPQGPN